MKLTKNTLYILGLLSISLCNRKTRFNLGGTMETVDAVCQRYGVPILSSLTDNDPAWVYDGSTDRLYQDPSVTDKVRYYHVLPNEPLLQTSPIRCLFFSPYVLILIAWLLFSGQRLNRITEQCLEHTRYKKY